MPPTLTRSTPPQTHTGPGRTAAGWAVAGAAAMLAAAVAGELLDPPSTVDLVIANESTQEVTVVLAGRAGAPVLPVATVDAGEERPVAEVLDQGSTWLVTFRTAGETTGELEVSRSELAEQGFRIVVPETVGDGDGPAPADAPEDTEG